MVAVGRIIRPHGNRGQVVVESETDFGETRFAAGSTLYARRGDAVEALVVESGRAHNGRWVVGFEGMASIDDAEARRGQELRIPPDAIHELGPNTFYAHDLVGCEVVTTAGTAIGAVTRVDIAAGPPMLVVGHDREPRSGERGEDVLVPFIDAICRHVDVARKRIEIDPPVGLIEVNERSGLRRSSDDR